MGSVFGASASGASRVDSYGAWLRLFTAAMPWLLAAGLTTATMNTELGPRADETDLPEAQPPPPPPPAPGHSDGDDDVYFDPMELISV